MAGPWTRYQTRDQSGFQPPSVQVRPPDPMRPLEMQGRQLQNVRTQQEIQSEPLQRERTQQEIQQNDTRGVNFSDEQSLRSQFEGNPVVRRYNETLTPYYGAMTAQDTRAGDLNLVYGMASIMDPGSVVREGEQVLVRGTGTIADRAREYISQINGTGGLSPELRANLRREIQARGRTMGELYHQQRQHYEDLARRYGFDPNAIVGIHPEPGIQRSLGINRDGSPIQRDQQESGFGGFDPETGQMVVNVTGGQRAQGQGVVPTPASEQWINSFGNTLAGIGQGIGAIPDAGANALGAVLSLPADALGFSNVANELRNPYTIGGTIEQAVPTPQDTTGRAVRFGSQMFGGVASLPQRATTGLANAVVGRVPAAPGNLAPSANQVLRDYQGANVPPMPADVGGAFTRRLTGAMAQMPGSAAPITRGAQRTIDAGGRELSRIANNTGVPTSIDRAGEAATRGALSYRSTSRNAANALYERAAAAAEGVTVTPTNAMSVLDQHLAELGQNPAAGQSLTYLQSLRDRIAAMPSLTVQGVRGMRTELRDRFLQDGLRGSDIERRAMEVVNAAGQDIASSLGQAGRQGAANLYARADAAWAQRAQTLDSIIMPIIGRAGERSPEQVVQALQQASRSNGGRLNQFLAALPEEEAGAVRATMIESIGRASAGQQGAEGTTFSLNQFLTNWNQMSNPARQALVGREGMAAMNRLARIAENAKAAGRFANTSNTGGPIGFVGTGATAGVGGSFFDGMGVVAGVLVAQNIAGRALANPRVANILAQIGGARTPQAAQSGVGRLNALVRASPALGQELAPLVRALNDNIGLRSVAAGQNPQREEDERRRQR